MPKKKNQDAPSKAKNADASGNFKPKKKWDAAPPKSSKKPFRGKPDRERPKKSERVAPPKPEPTVVDATTFTELGLAENTLKAIADLGFEVPTPIQALAIPALLTGGDFIGLAQTGTGKTAAFGLPLIEKLSAEDSSTQALILAPTRELAVQVAKGIHDFAKYAGLKVVPVYGGQPMDRQFRALRMGPQIVVGTPGRVLDHLRRGSLKLDEVKACVLDEADEMMAMGFSEDLDAILSELPESRQLAFFSATMAPRVLDITKKFLRDPQKVEIVAKQRTLETTNQTYYEVAPGKKQEALVRVLDMETPGSTIVFCRTRLETAELSDSLGLHGYNAEPIHGDMSQNDRERVLRRFRDGMTDLLIATDVAARGLDIDSVTHVINYDVPYDVEQYIHRIGRTGRAGRTGDAITLIYRKEKRKLENIERLIGSKIQPARIPTTADIAYRRREAFVELLRETLEAGEYEAMLSAADELAEQFDPLDVAAAALQLLWKERHQRDHVEDEEESFADFEQPEMGMVRIFVGMGRNDGLRPGDLVGAIINEAGLNGKQVGVIEILDRASFVEVPTNEGQRVVEALANTKLRNRKVKIEFAQPAFGTTSGPSPKKGRGEFGKKKKGRW
ncbi:MAG: DEAD/DEAH box helicase [Armatimonadetes bacterium]|nr:DEAD/DEAH box helicase [Armatimonadota bacterium]